MAPDFLQAHRRHRGTSRALARRTPIRRRGCGPTMPPPWPPAPPRTRP
jgi:hypothetical protein